uniref:Enoyl reductase (ER) domain-containing protein n=1 Tax=Bionectria ochroleuca TaxID=29856 RepID=A0A8H7MYH7_BIOOC
MSGIMLAQELHAAKDLRLVKRSIEPPAEDEVQIAMRATTLCGSDLHYFTHFANGDFKIREPLSPGHECSGVIVSLGAAAEKNRDLKVGDRVAVEVGVPCGDCDHCAEGTYNVCGKLRFRSSATAFPHYQGTLQQRFNHPAQWVHKLPESISFAEGALLEPLAVAIHAVRKADAKKGASCLVVGAGAVGLLCAAVARSFGYRHIVLADIVQNRLDFAISNGFADAAVKLPARRSRTTEEGLVFAKEDAESLRQQNGDKAFDRTFECTGVESCATRNGGKILLVGMGTPVQTLPISAAALREVDILGVWRYANCYPRGIELMEYAGREGIPDLKKLITHSFQGLEEAGAAFDMAAKTCDGEGRLVIKVVLENAE